MIKRVAFIFVLFFAFQPAKTQNALDIIEKSNAKVKFDAMEMIVMLRIYDNKGNERTRTVSTATKEFNGINKTLIKFISPADVKGTSMLIFDYKEKNDDMWIYMPAIGKTRRIVCSEKGKSFMGSEFTNADMSSPNISDFAYKLIGSENYQGELCWKIEALCKDENVQDENGFYRKISWISQRNYLAHKIEFYDFDNELFKIQSIGDYRLQSNGKYFAFSMTAENLQNGRKSVMQINKFLIGSELTESVFSPIMLEK